jgi:serine/threonine-protein kinase
LRKEAFANEEIVTRFSREAYLLGQIHSDHVARVLDFMAETPYGPVLVMEFVDGPSLLQLLETKQLSIEEALELGIDIASALKELHAAGVIHRDVKPANVILRKHHDTHRAVFVDLGVSRLVSDRRSDSALTEITCDDRALGTAEYMAPEQILSARNVTGAADLYALGAILYRAVAGRNVFGTDTHGVELLRRKLTVDPPALHTGRADPVAKGFEELVRKSLSRALEERYENADEMLTDLYLLRDAARHASKTLPPITAKHAPRRITVPAAWPGFLAAAFIVLCTGIVAGASVAGRISLSIACDDAAVGTRR